MFEGISPDVRDLAAPLLQKHGLLKGLDQGKQGKGGKDGGQSDIGATVDI